jgi:hypothetical protein
MLNVIMLSLILLSLIILSVIMLNAVMLLVEAPHQMLKWSPIIYDSILLIQSKNAFL